MKLKINKVEIGAEFDGMIWDYWIDAVLPNGEAVKIFDYKGLNLKKFEGGYVDVNVKALFVESIFNDDLLCLQAKLIRESQTFFLSNDIGIRIEIKEEDVIINKLPINKHSFFYLGRLDLESISAVG